jgi:Tol biopolymer transport system component
MKIYPFLILLVLPLYLYGQSDRCAKYNDIEKQTIRALKAEDYQKALLKLNVVKENCYEKRTQADELIWTVFEAMELKIRKARREMEKARDKPARFKTLFAAYLILEAQKAFLKEDIRLAWWLTMESLKQNPNNDKAQLLNQVLPGYGTDFFLDVPLESRYLDENLQSSPDATYFSFFTQESGGGYTLNVLELGRDQPPLTFPNSYYENYPPNCYRYSPDSRHLVFFTKANDGKGTLNLLQLGENKAPLTFPGSSLQSYYSPDSRYLVFSTMADDSTNTLNVLDLEGNEPLLTFSNSYHGEFHSPNYFSPDSRYLVFTTNENDGKGDLNVLELGKDQRPLVFPNSSNSYRFSPDSRQLLFFTRETDESYTLNLLELGKDQLPLRFSNSYHEEYDSPNRFSPDSRYLVFFTNEYNEMGTLNVLELGGIKSPRTFPNSFTDNDFYCYSPGGQHLIFFSNVVDYNTGTLNVLELGENTPPLSFPNIDCEDHSDYDYDGVPYSYRFSPDSRQLIFFTKEANGSYTLNVLELGKEQQPLMFPNSRIFDEEDEDSSPFSPNSQYLIFFNTREVGEEYTLNVLKQEGQKAPISFPNSNHNYWSWSLDSRHLVFFTKANDGKDALNLLKLGDDKPIRFPNSRYPYQYSPDSQHLVFLTDSPQWPKGTLKVLDLGEQELLLNFPNSVFDCYFSPEDRHLVFFTDATDWPKGTLNVLEMGSNTSPLKFPDSYRYGHRYSPDGRHLAFLAGDHATTNILKLDSKKVSIQIKNQYPVEGGIKFLNKNHLLAISRNPINQKNIYKIINLERIGEGYWDYLIEERYAPLTTEEKRLFGIVD